MKDQLYLFLTGIICAGLAWGFFAFTQQSAFDIIVLIFIIVICADNYRLRNQLKQKKTIPE